MIRLLLIIFLYGTFGQMLGPADVKFTRIEKCAEPSQGASIFFQKHKINRTHDGTDFNFTIPFNIDQQVAINITVDKWGDGGWKPNFMTLGDDNMCKFLLKYGEKKITELAAVLKLEPKCPIPAGTYSANAFVYDGEIDYPTLYGEFRCDFRFLRNGAEWGCLRVFVTTKPKMKKFGR